MEKKVDRRGFLRTLPFFPAAIVDEIVDGSEKEEKKEYKPVYIRPPYFVEDADLTLCKECEGFCLTSCEENIIQRSEDGVPYIIFKNTGCTFCEKCAEECPEDVLSVEKGEKRIQVNISIDIDRCVAWKKTMCFSCKEPCLDNAIKFEGLFNPQIIPDKCTGCGFCISVCPTGAISLDVPSGEGYD
ncbi:ferredoxin-type protein NapF [Persephonella sp.]